MMKSGVILLLAVSFVLVMAAGSWAEQWPDYNATNAGNSTSVTSSDNDDTDVLTCALCVGAAYGLMSSGWSGGTTAVGSPTQRALVPEPGAMAASLALLTPGGVSVLLWRLRRRRD